MKFLTCQLTRCHKLSLIVLVESTTTLVYMICQSVKERLKIYLRWQSHLKMVRFL